jgi:hypothetical protein
MITFCVCKTTSADISPELSAVYSTSFAHRFVLDIHAQKAEDSGVAFKVPDSN